jgi:Uma2 family endonuclease
MAPASKTYTIIEANVFRALDQALAGTHCHVFMEGVQILTDEISAIPDAVVSCAPIDLSTPVVAEPVIIVEVMSPSSEYDDGGRK